MVTGARMSQQARPGLGAFAVGEHVIRLRRHQGGRAAQRLAVRRGLPAVGASQQAAADQSTSAAADTSAVVPASGDSSPPIGAPLPDIPAPASVEAVAEEFVAATQSPAETTETVRTESVKPPSVSVAAPPPSGAIPLARQFIRDNPVPGYSLAALVAFLGITFVVAVGRVAARYFTPQAKRGRTVNKNKVVVEELAKYLPANRAGLTGPVALTLRLKTGFSPAEMFRKYLWFLLRERPFDAEAVADLVALKAALGLSDEQVAGALRERAQRVYDKYGNVMLDTSGMSQAGVERKAAAKSLFSKMLFLVGCEEVLAPAAAEGVNLREIFGATEDDVAALRITSLYDVDLEAAVGLPSAQGGSRAGDREGDE